MLTCLKASPHCDGQDAPLNQYVGAIDLESLPIQTSIDTNLKILILLTLYKCSFLELKITYNKHLKCCCSRKPEKSNTCFIYRIQVQDAILFG